MMLTKNHQAFVSEKGIQKAKVAQEVTLQDKVFVWNGEELVEEEIESLDYVFQNGYRKPLTEQGTLLGQLQCPLSPPLYHLLYS